MFNFIQMESRPICPWKYERSVLLWERNLQASVVMRSFSQSPGVFPAAHGFRAGKRKSFVSLMSDSLLWHRAEHTVLRSNMAIDKVTVAYQNSGGERLHVTNMRVRLLSSKKKIITRVYQIWALNTAIYQEPGVCFAQPHQERPWVTEWVTVHVGSSLLDHRVLYINKKKRAVGKVTTYLVSLKYLSNKV